MLWVCDPCRGQKRGKLPAESLVIEDAKAETSLEKTQRQQVPSQGASCCLCHTWNCDADLMVLRSITGNG